MLIREPNGSVHEVTPVYGVGKIPFPEAAVHDAVVGTPPVGVVVIVTCMLGRKLVGPAGTSPPAVCTVSERLTTVSVSCASSVTLRTENEQVYGTPTAVGLVHPFVNEIPCWTSACASPGPAPIVRTKPTATTSTPVAHVKRNRRILSLPQ